MALIEIQQNDPLTLERARLQVHNITSAKEHHLMQFQWTYAAGYFMALAAHDLIDEATKCALDIEADQARDAWQSRNV
jgi:hypothetical protein